MLKSGDKVGVISPSSFIEKGSIEEGISYLESFGLTTVLGNYTNSIYRYMGGNDEQRAQDIMDFFKNPEIKAIFCTRGGGGSTRLLPYLDYEVIKNNPKPIFGLSDSTGLQNAIYAKSGNISYTGFLLVYDFRSGAIDGLVDASLQEIFKGNKLVIKDGETVISGVAEGAIIGGNIATFCRLFGTGYCPDFKDKILLLEDVGGKTWQLDLMLEQIKQQANFDKLKGIVFGAFTNCQQFDVEDGTVDENIAYFCDGLNIPIIKNFTYGHIPSRHVLPIGKLCRLDANNCCLEEID